jgi:transposase
MLVANDIWLRWWMNAGHLDQAQAIPRGRSQVSAALELLGTPEDCLVAMEATSHYWRNLFAWLVSKGFSVALLNPLRTRRFAEEELERTKTDAIDALGIALCAAEASGCYAARRHSHRRAARARAPS